MPASAKPKQPLSRAYTLKASKIPNYFGVLLGNPVPEIFDTAFLAKSGFRYAIDRAFIDILTGLGFLTEAGQPTRRYTEFHGRRQAGTVLRQGLAEAYAGLLAALPEAAACPERQIVEIVSRYFEGEINDMVACGIAATFLALTRYAADLDNGAAIAGAAVAGATQPAVATIPASKPTSPAAVASGPSAEAVSKPAGAPKPVSTSEPVAATSPAFTVAPAATPQPVAQASGASPQTAPEATNDPAATPPASDMETTDKTDGAPGIVIEAFSPEGQDQAPKGSPQRPVIHITLPASTDEAVYDAIFVSLKRHLLPPGDNA